MTTPSKELTAVHKFALEELKILSRIPSISFPGFEASAVKRSAEATADLLSRVGLDRVRLESIDDCFPYVLAEKIVDKNAPTLLLYAHHDVQPAGREELWQSPPFEPTERNGRLYGRGTADDKAGILCHVASVLAFKDQPLPVNVKFIIEGEEEIGSPHLLKFLESRRDALQADAIIVTDTGNIREGTPSITTSLRGLVSLDVEIRSLRAPLHSGIWGGGVVDPVQVLVKVLAQLSDEAGRPILKSVKRDKEPHRDCPLSREEFAQQAGVLKTESVPTNFVHRVWDEASFSINAIQASSEKLANNIVCDRAFCRIGLRITATETAQAVLQDIVATIRLLVPSTVELKITPRDSADAWSMDPQEPRHRWVFETVESAFHKGFGQKVAYIGCGATIPFIGPFERAFHAPVVTVGIEDPQAYAHSENESLLLCDFYRAIDSQIEFFKQIPAAFKKRPIGKPLD